MNEFPALKLCVITQASTEPITQFDIRIDTTAQERAFHDSKGSYLQNIMLEVRSVLKC